MSLSGYFALLQEGTAFTGEWLGKLDSNQQIRSQNPLVYQLAYSPIINVQYRAYFVNFLNFFQVF